MIKWNVPAAALGTALVLLTSAADPARAEEVEKKFRLALAIGGYNTQSEIRSDAPNVRVVVDDKDQPVYDKIYFDPRNDSASIGTLGVKSSYRAVATAAYAFTRRFVVEGSVGYQKGDVGDVELQVQFPLQEPVENQEFDMRIYRYNAGSLTQVPIEITAFARFRPKARMSPYIGAGVGYTFMEFSPSDELNTLSRNMDASMGSQSRITGSRGTRSFDDPNVTLDRDLTGATVDARGTFEWHAAGGLEIVMKGSWSAYVDLRYIFASRAMTLRFNGGTDFGRSVPDTIYDETDPRVNDTYGPMRIHEGGLVDGGQIVCEGSNCSFVEEPDGSVDPGWYYVKGGSIKYGGVALQLGVKYTF